MKKNGVPLWKIWVLTGAVIVSSIVLIILCIVTKPSSISSTTVNNTAAEKENESAQDAVRTAPIVQQSAEIAEQFPMPEVKKSSIEDATNIEKNNENASEKEEESVPVAVNTNNKAAKVKKFDIPLATNGATLVFIFDDAGQSLTKLQKYTNKLAFPFTVAVLPYLPHSKDCASELAKKEKEVMLHQPMQAVNLNVNPGPGAIMPNMDSYSIEEQLRKNIDSLGVKIAGMNNHEGSLITSDLVKMLDVLQVVKEKGIYFVDSRTTAQTKAPQAAQLLGLNIFSNDVFLDNEVERNAILSQVYRGLAVANKNGRAVMIGHIDKSSDIIPQLLSEMYSELRDSGYKFATLSMYR
mgnify:CR=1 FL=1